MRRIVESVGVGDTGTSLSACLQVSPFNGDEVALLLQGSQKSTQTGNLLEIRDSSGNALLCADYAGVLYPSALDLDAATIAVTTLKVTSLTATNIYGKFADGNSTALIHAYSVKADVLTATTISGATNIHATTITATNFKGSDATHGAISLLNVNATTVTATTIQTTTVSSNGTIVQQHVGNGKTATRTATMLICGSTAATVVTAGYIPVVAGSIVAVEVIAAAIATAGTALNSGGMYRVQGVAVNAVSGNALGVLVGATTQTAISCASVASAWAVNLVNGNATNAVIGVTVLGSASVPINWALHTTYTVMNA